MQTYITGQIRKSIQVKEALLEAGTKQIAAAGQVLATALSSGRKLLFCGNGGSAADAQHIATEFLIRYKAQNIRPALPALSLAADSSALTACANDFGFDQLFARQVEGLGQAGDVLVAITTSGNSDNIKQALLVAKEKKMKTILLTGATGGSILAQNKELIDVVILVPAQETSRLQECHILIGHLFCGIVEKTLYNMS